MKEQKRTNRSKKGSVPATKAKKSASAVTWDELDRSEQVSVVANLFCNGLRMAEVAETISERYATDFTREATYPIIAEAARRGWIRYVPPPEIRLQSMLKNEIPWLKNGKVIHTNQFEDVACHGGEMLLSLLEEYRLKGRDEVHIGFAGGHAMRKLVQAFAPVVKDAGYKVPKKVILHALVAGFDVYEPTTDPNTFFTLFHSTGPVDPQLSYVGLHTPPVVRSDHFAELRTVEGIRESYDCAKQIDIIVTSATNWSDEHSTFRKYMQISDGCSSVLEKAGCIGDMLWLPVGSDGPVKVKTKIRPMTLLELDELPRLIKGGKYVLLVLGPCSKCSRPKADILKAILSQAWDKRLITHLVADSRSVREVFK